ncbi:MAG: DNA polymerase IV [Deltaproteobacteria bacterium]|nr:DNA polymerase IV [Deltaproteobacteria bacterium]
MERCIIHLDMDAFYASIEQRDHPELRGQPVVVGGSSRRAVVAAASYEARKFGIHSAMPMMRARRLCPDLVVADVHMEHYREVSRQIRGILERHTELIEPLALDEFFLDVTEQTGAIPEAGRLAQAMKAEIQMETGLTGSAGVGPNKFVAKVASDLRKPDGLVVVPPAEGADFLAPLPVSRVWGVGAVTERKLEGLGIRTIGDLAGADPQGLERLFGKLGPRIHQLANGVDDRPVQVSRQPKSVSHETTFEEDTTDLDLLRERLGRLAQRVSERLRRRGLQGRTVVLKLTYHNFQHATRHATLEQPTDDDRAIAAEAARLLDRTEAAVRPVRLVGVGLTGLTSTVSAGAPQLGLFGPESGGPADLPSG